MASEDSTFSLEAVTWSFLLIVRTLQIVTPHKGSTERYSDVPAFSQIC